MFDFVTKSGEVPRPKGDLYEEHAVRYLFAALTLPAAVEAQLTYTTNADGVSLTISGYTGSGGDVTIPANINRLAVTNIGDMAFKFCHEWLLCVDYGSLAPKSWHQGDFRQDAYVMWEPGDTSPTLGVNNYNDGSSFPDQRRILLWARAMTSWAAWW